MREIETPDGGPRPLDMHPLDLQWNPRWVATAISASAVRLSAGTDRQLDIDGLAADDVSALVAWADRRGGVTDLSDVVAAHLVELGIAQPVGALDSDRALTVAVVAVNDEAALVAEAIGAVLGVQLTSDRAVAGERADLAVIVRCGPGKVGPDVQQPRLIVDVGAQHTVVIGPFVVPGRSACEECLDHLIARRWTAVVQPALPATADSRALIAELVARHVALISAGASPVIGNTIAFDVDAMVARRDPLLMSPICSTCGITTPDPRPNLPWETT